jgi:hypothetical protein
MSSSRIDWKWVFIAFVILLAVQVAVQVVFVVFGILTLGFGFLLFMIVRPLSYFLAGYITGVASPGVTLREPAIAAAAVVVLGAIVDASRSGPGGLLWTIITAVLAFFLALAGARVGERRQSGTT